MDYFFVASHASTMAALPLFLLFLALRPAQEGTADGAPLSRLGLSVDHGHRVACIRAIPDRVHYARPEDRLYHWQGLAAEPRDAGSAHSPSQLSNVSAVAVGDSPQRKPSVTTLAAQRGVYAETFSATVFACRNSSR